MVDLALGMRRDRNSHRAAFRNDRFHDLRTQFLQRDPASISSVIDQLDGVDTRLDEPTDVPASLLL